MPDFKYQGTSRSGASVSGVMTAGSKAELQNILRRQQITPTKMSEKGKEFNMPTFGGGVKAKELAIFTRQFSVMIDAGLPLVQCLEILASQQENKFFQKVLATTRAQVEGGATLSAAMRSAPKVFDGLYVNMVEA
nr:type II secretion system F family protein [Acidobacteriota bacterium]